MEKLAIKEKAIRKALKMLKYSITFTTEVGACLYTKYKLYPGFNIENKIHKGYHAEEVAVINALLHGEYPSSFIGIIIAGSYPSCASCRQLLWEFTNGSLLITIVDNEGNIMYENTLKELYPMPYPESQWYGK